MARIDLVSPAVGEVLSVEQAKAFARATHAAEDGLFAGWIDACASFAEEWTRRQFLTAEFELVGHTFQSLARRTGSVVPWSEIVLERAPLRQLVSVIYLDADGVWQTLPPGSFSLRMPLGPTCGFGSIVRGVGMAEPEWPCTQKGAVDAVRIRFKAGYGTKADVPAGITAALMAGVAELYANRELARWREVLASQLENFRL
jgi:uncharacterized phiE125 gp8 family phage protein